MSNVLLDETNARPRIVVAHDYLTQRGGAERVALALAEELNPAEFVTSVYSADRTFPGFEGTRPKVSFLQRIRLARRDPRFAFPLLPFAWNSIEPIDADVVVCSSSGWAHGLRVTPRTKKVVYCHNPARWLYQSDDYLIDQRLPVRWVLNLLAPMLRAWDKRAAATADAYVANSTSVARRIKEAYGIEAKVIFPPVSLRDVAPIRPEGIEGTSEYFLTIGRARGYKNTHLLVDAFRRLPGQTLIVVGETVADCPPNVHVLKNLTDEEIAWLYSNARALMSVSHEDFGLTPIEANQHGTPSLVLRAGGFLDSTVEGVTGMFIESEDVADIAAAVASFSSSWDRDAIVASTDRYHPRAFARALLAAVSEMAPPPPAHSNTRITGHPNRIDC